MKLIIDIPEDVYTRLFDNGIQDNEIAVDDVCEIARALRLGTPLDDVKAEMEKQIKRDFAFAETETLKVPCHYGTANGLQVAVRILDNIGKAESEEV